MMKRGQAKHGWHLKGERRPSKAPIRVRGIAPDGSHRCTMYAEYIVHRNRMCSQHKMIVSYLEYN